MRCLVAIAVLFCASPATAALRKDFPYAGSVYESVDTPRAPLLLVLHGDNQSAAAMREVWSAPAAKRSIAVLYLQCPGALGCKGSFWAWNGEPRFIDDAVEAVAGDIDPDRVWIAGWSGGASYLGRRAFELSDRYAALSFHGGGLAPQESACPARVLPAYFLVGDKNPLHHLAKDLRRALEACAGEVRWDLRSGADHASEWKALRADADQVLAWFTSHARVRPAPVAFDAGSDAGSDAATDAGFDPGNHAGRDAGRDAGSPSASGPGAQPPPSVRCSCDVGAQTGTPWSLLLGLACCARRRARRRATPLT